MATQNNTLRSRAYSRGNKYLHIAPDFVNSIAYSFGRLAIISVNEFATSTEGELFCSQ